MLFYAIARCKFRNKPLVRKQRRLSVDFITYFTVLQTKTYIVHISTFPTSIGDKNDGEKVRHGEMVRLPLLFHWNLHLLPNIPDQ